MTESNNEKQSDLNVTTAPGDMTDAPEPTFLDDEGPLDIPLFITTTNARELFDLLPGETVAQAAVRKASER